MILLQPCQVKSSNCCLEITLLIVHFKRLKYINHYLTINVIKVLKYTVQYVVKIYMIKKHYPRCHVAIS